MRTLHAARRSDHPFPVPPVLNKRPHRPSLNRYHRLRSEAKIYGNDFPLSQNRLFAYARGPSRNRALLRKMTGEKLSSPEAALPNVQAGS